MKWIRSGLRPALALGALLAVATLAMASIPAAADDSGDLPQPANAAVAAAIDTSVPVAEASATFDPDGLRGSVDVLDADTGTTTTFSSFDKLVGAFEADGRVLIADDTRLTKDSAVVEPRATYVLATFYSEPSYGGSTLLVTTTISTYCTSTTWADNIYGSWNDNVSSFKTFGNCKTQLWENPGRTGSSYGPAVQAASLGVMNNQASSYRIAK